MLSIQVLIVMPATFCRRHDSRNRPLSNLDSSSCSDGAPTCRTQNLFKIVQKVFHVGIIVLNLSGRCPNIEKKNARLPFMNTSSTFQESTVLRGSEMDDLSESALSYYDWQVIHALFPIASNTNIFEHLNGRHKGCSRLRNIRCQDAAFCGYVQNEGELKCKRATYVVNLSSPDLERGYCTIYTSLVNDLTPRAFRPLRNALAFKDRWRNCTSFVFPTGTS